MRFIGTDTTIVAMPLSYINSPASRPAIVLIEVSMTLAGIESEPCLLTPFIQHKLDAVPCGWLSKFLEILTGRLLLPLYCRLYILSSIDCTYWAAYIIMNTKGFVGICLIWLHSRHWNTSEKAIMLDLFSSYFSNIGKGHNLKSQLYYPL